MREQALSLLRTALNNPRATFRSGQWEAIETIVHHRSRLLVVQRTGWGKSFVYFVAARLLRDRGRGTTFLISPLIALMRNQIAAASRINVRAETINSDNTEDWPRIQRELLDGNVDILLISPERLGNEQFQAEILFPLSSKVGLFAG
jgi:ATP-dependent DNA helicase RecQ